MLTPSLLPIIIGWDRSAPPPPAAPRLMGTDSRPGANQSGAGVLCGQWESAERLLLLMGEKRVR